MIKNKILFFFCFLSLTCLSAQNIKLNQVGFYPDADKVAVVPGETASTCDIVDEQGTVVQSFPVGTAATYGPSGEKVQLCDFSAFTKTGRFKLVVTGVGESYYFDIHPAVHLGVLKGSIRAFYYNRASTAILPQYGGVYTRAEGHPDTVVLIHSSAASAERPAGTKISSPKGWYDAGDYNKYIVNSGISTFTLLSAYEHYSKYYDSLALNIPESGNKIPDLLDEALWNIEWMLTMQDPNDGGVYHKCTSLQFSGTVAPANDKATRYVVMKTTAATLDFAAVMAVASRIFKKFESEKPGFSAKCLAAAEAAWNWAQANPAVYYAQPSDVGTGTYADSDVSQEFDWASAELFITTSDQSYLTSQSVLSSPIAVPDWANVSGLPWISLGLHRDSLSATDKQAVETKILNFANTLYNSYNTSAYKIAMTYFGWGSNGTAGNQGLMLLQAYDISADPKYLKAAISNLDYLLGRNPTGYCYVTGYGSKSPQNIHHRLSASDNVPGPIPGFVAGGANQGREDGCSYSSTLPALSYSDTFCSYASNEVAINWNAPLVYLLGAIEAINSNAPKAPAILIPPSPVSTQLSKTASFTVFASGSGIMYQWQKNGENINGATDSILTLASVTADDEAIYRVLVYNTTDTVISREVQLRLLIKAPYGGTRAAIPGTVQAENYDEGGPEVGYHDTTPGNDGGAYRNDDVDLGGTNVGWTANGEWLNYSVHVSQTTTYRVEISGASPNTGTKTGNITLLVDGVAVSSGISMPATGSWSVFSSVYVDTVALTAGDHDLRVQINTAGFNLDYLKFSVFTEVVDKKGTGIALYPNPSAEAFTLTLDKVKQGATLVVTSVDGKEVLNRQVDQASITFGHNLEKGFYIGRIVEEDKVRVFEFVKF